MQVQMIYAQSNVAALIAARLAKSKGVQYAVTKVTTGFQVAPVTKVEPKTPAPLPTPAAKIEWVPTPEGPKPTVVPVSNNLHHTVKLKFRGESPKYVDAWLDGKPISFGKSTLISWKLSTDPESFTKWVEITMPKAVAKKRGLLAA